MSTDSAGHQVTWQKIAVVASILFVAVPFAADALWSIFYPDDYLLYEVRQRVAFDGRTTQLLVINNAGRKTQKNVAVILDASKAYTQRTLVDVSTPKRIFLSGYSAAEPDVPLSDFSRAASVFVPLGNIEPDEQVVVAFGTREQDGIYLSGINSDVRVESSTTVAIKADGIRRPSTAHDAHSGYVELAPGILAFIVAIVSAIVIIALVFGIFFDSPEKQMTRLWRQLDDLQEKIDKERRYK